MDWWNGVVRKSTSDADRFCAQLIVQCVNGTVDCGGGLQSHTRSISTKPKRDVFSDFCDELSRSASRHLSGRGRHLLFW